MVPSTVAPSFGLEYPCPFLIVWRMIPPSSSSVMSSPLQSNSSIYKYTKENILFNFHEISRITRCDCSDIVEAHLENKSGIWGDLGRAACRSICIPRLTDELAQFSNFHCGHPDVPCLYYLTCAQRGIVTVIDNKWTFTLGFNIKQTSAQHEGETVISGPAVVKQSAVQKPALIMHKYSVTG